MALLSDVGGIISFLVTIVRVLLKVYNYNYVENYMVSKLYKSSSQDIVLRSNTRSNMKEFFMKSLHHKLVCCKKNRKHIAMERARVTLEKDLDIVNLIRSRRFYHHALE